MTMAVVNRIRKLKVRDMNEHLKEIETLFLERLKETDQPSLTKGIISVREAFKVLSEDSLSEEDREHLVTSLGMALSDATENFMFEFLLATGYYKDESEFCKSGVSTYGLIEGEGTPYIDLRLISEMTVYAQLHAWHFTDPEFAAQDYDLMIRQFEAGRKEKVVLKFCSLRDEMENKIQELQTQLDKVQGHTQHVEVGEASAVQVLQQVYKKLEAIIGSYYGNEAVESIPQKPSSLPTRRDASVVVSFTRSVTLFDVPAGCDEKTIKEWAAEQFNSLDPEDRDMGPEHATVIEILEEPSIKVLRLSELTGKNEWRDEVENFLYEHRDATLMIDAGFYLEVYTNPEGVFEEEQTPNGASTFIWVDEDTAFNELLELFEEMGRIRDQTLTIQVIPSEDNRYARERRFAEENPISTLKNEKRANHSINIDLITRIAQWVRDELEEELGTDYTDFQGACVIASDRISSRLNEFGLANRIVSGWIRYDDASSCSDRDYDEHTWVEVEDLIVDVTLTQFDPFMNGPLPKVYVGEKPEYLHYDEPAQ